MSTSCEKATTPDLDAAKRSASSTAASADRADLGASATSLRPLSWKPWIVNVVLNSGSLSDKRRDGEARDGQTGRDRRPVLLPARPWKGAGVRLALKQSDERNDLGWRGHMGPCKSVRLASGAATGCGAGGIVVECTSRSAERAELTMARTSKPSSR